MMINSQSDSKTTIIHLYLILYIFDLDLLWRMQSIIIKIRVLCEGKTFTMPRYLLIYYRYFFREKEYISITSKITGSVDCFVSREDKITLYITFIFLKIIKIIYLFNVFNSY